MKQEPITMDPVRDGTHARAWLPGPARAIAAACPECVGGPLVYSVGDAYLACLDCGWQRRLITAGDQRDAALAAAGWAHRPWAEVLDALAARDADALPPVPALLWQQTSPRTWRGPSRTRPGVQYTVTAGTARLCCTCLNRGVGCWHVERAQQLGAVRPVRSSAEIQARGAAALADLFGAA